VSNYLVTGGAGFIGSAVARALLERGDEVQVIDNLSTGRREAVPPGADFVEGDVQDAGLYQGLKLQHVDAIYHIAGQSSGEISFDDPVYDLQTNVQSTLLLCSFAIRIDCPKIIYASTMSVYGDHGSGPIDELATPTPRSFYGIGKLASEHYLRLYAERGMATVAARLFNVYGPGQNLENMRQGMVSIFMAQALRDGQVLVKGSGTRFRDFIYIDDVVSAFLALEKCAVPGTHIPVNIGTGRKTTVDELLSGIESTLPYPLEIEFRGSTLGDQMGIVANIERMSTLGGWAPRVPLEAGLSRMADWALSPNRLP
jgi:UDP-glucose 4-epimerase